MSRNKEKSQSVLHRFQALKDEEAGVLQSNPNLRPKNVQSVKSLPQAEKWRSTLMSEISVKLTSLNNPELNDYQLRDLNDEVNKKYKEKRAWEHHILNLGGPDYINLGKNTEMPGLRLNGYRYFGRAKELPDVKEILQAQTKRKRENIQKRGKSLAASNTLSERNNRITPTYHGLYDEVDSTGIGEIDISIGSIVNEVNEVIGREVLKPKGFINDKYPSGPHNDPLISYERSIRRKLQRSHKAKEDEKLVINFNDQVPNNQEVSKWLIDRRRRELIARLNAKN